MRIPVVQIENEIQDLLYAQRAIVRMDVYARDPQTGALKLVTSNVEEDAGTMPTIPSVGGKDGE